MYLISKGGRDIGRERRREEGKEEGRREEGRSLVEVKGLNFQSSSVTVWRTEFL